MRTLKGKLFLGLATIVAGSLLLALHAQVAYAAQDQSSGPLPLGIQSDAQTSYPGISWLRLSYPTCGNSNLSGEVLRNTIRDYHREGIRILLTVCQPDLSTILNPAPYQDAAQGRADAVECGNEQMKYAPPYTRYVPPDLFAQFFDICEGAIHAVRPQVPVLLGSLDPRVAGPDNAILAKQAAYLNAVQTAMNTIVHPGGNWSWRSQIIGLIDSWHNGYPTSDNNLYALFAFWAQQFQVNLASGQLGQHLWVVEGTPCFKSCGLKNAYQIAVTHIITMITDVLTSQQYSVPFFYFTGKDFVLGGILWPIGVLDLNGNPKPLRQDLPMGARTLPMTCSTDRVTEEVVVADQEQLLARLSSGCQLPANYASILES